MMNVHQAMQGFVSSLEIKRCVPDGGRRCGTCTYCDAIRQRDALRQKLERGLSVSKFLISGSFKRRTAIHPLNDIDLFLVLEPNAEKTLREGPPSRAIARIQEVLDDAYPSKDKPKAQTRSVNISFSGTGLAFDVVPAFEHGDGYVIPDRAAGRWIGTDPRVHAEHATAANEASGNKAKPIVKALKRWNAERDAKVVRSFHLELMVYDQLRDDPDNYAAGTAQAFRGLAGRVLSPMPDPAGLGPDVDAGMSFAERQAASAAFSDAAHVADKALIAAKDGRIGEAHYHWRSLLGSAYPEKGTAPKHGSSLAASFASGSAPDPKRSRFG